MKSASSKTPRWRVKILCSVSGIMLCVILLIAQGCKRQEETPAGAEVTPDEGVVISLETTFAGLKPDEFESNVPRDLPTSDINEWGAEMLADMVDPEVDEKELAESLSELLPDDMVERILRPEFVLRDSSHIRDCLWARQLSESVTARSESELDAIVDLFYFVVNTVRVVPAEESLPFGPFESTLHGMGTTGDRAWIFATLLRQRRIPTLVFVSDESDEPAGNLIVGALLNGSIYLFDAGLGLPIASPEASESSVLVRQPATLAELVADESVLAGMGAGGPSPYGISLEQFKQLQPQVIGDSSVWSRRMEGLRNGQPVEVKAIIFEALISCGPFEGIVEIVSEHLSKVLPEAKLGVWLYPEEQREARESVRQDKDQSKRLASLEDTFLVPQPVTAAMVPDKGNPGKQKLEIVVGTSWGTHRRSRVNQILGRPEEAIPAYLNVQNWRTLPPSPDDQPIDAQSRSAVAQQLPEDVKQRHQNAAEEAFVWRATCQIQKQAFASAAVTLEEYIRQSATGTHSGQFGNEANYLAGLSLALSGNSRRGAAFLRKVDSDNSRYDVARWLIARWTAQSEKDK